MADINERLLGYLRRNILGRRWQLDGASPEQAFLGKGTYGYVYAVYCEEMDRVTGKVTRQNAALKIIPVDETIFEGMRNAAELSDEEKQRKLNAEYRKDRQEIDIMEKVRGTTEIAYFLNSKIIERTDTRLKSWDVVILMDRLVSLEKYMADHSMTPGTRDFLPQVLHIWRDISTALRHCENVSIIHTDVKRANVLYSPWKQAFVLSDFGEAVPEKNYAPGRSRRGTLDYMSPEMYYKQGGDSRMDMYSLALMIYEMLNGYRLPFQEGADRKSAREARLTERRSIPPIKGIPPEVNAVLLRCLEYEPDKRYASCKQMEDAVLELYVRNPPKGPDDTDNRTPRPPRGKPPMPLITGAAVVVIALGIAGWLIFGNKEPEPTPTPTQTQDAQATVRPDAEEDGTAVAPVDVTATPTPGTTPTPSPTPSPSPTVSPTPAPARRLILTHVDRPIQREGDRAVIRGNISTQGDTEADGAVLLVNGEPWRITLGGMEENGTYSFEAAGTLPEDVRNVRLQLSLALPDDTTLFSSEMEAPVIAPTASPSPTPAPRLTLRLSDGEVVSGEGELSLSGEVGIEGELSSDDLRLRLDNQYIDEVEWTAVEGGYAFTAVISMDLEGVPSLEVSVLSPGNAGIEPATQSLTVATPTPGAVETPVAYAAIALNEDPDGTALTLDESLTISGSAQPDEALDCTINGESTGKYYVVEADGSFSLPLSSDALTEGENTIRLSYASGERADAALEFTLLLDTQGPVIEAPESIDQFTTEMRVRADDTSQPCAVTLQVDGAAVDEQTPDATGYVTFTGLDTTGLSAESNIEIIATDALGNRARSGIAYVRSLTSIGVTNRSALEAAPVGLDGATVEISALSGATLRVRRGEADGTTLNVDGNGYAGFTVGPDNLEPGENIFTIEYEEVDGEAVADADAQSVELTVFYDGEAPAFTTEPSELVTGERELTLAVSNETLTCLAELTVDGTGVMSETFDPAQPYTLAIPDDVGLDGGDSVELAVTDAAGNVSRLPVRIIHVEPITVTNAQALSEGVKGSDDELTLNLAGESGAGIAISNGDETTTATLSESYDIRPLLHSGVNNISIEYTPANGFPERALGGTSCELTINYDGDAPEPALDETQLTRDTARLTLHVPNEPNGYAAALYVDGAVVWSAEGIVQEDCEIDGVKGFGLSEDSDIRLSVDDGANPPVELVLTYSNTSVYKDVDGALEESVEAVIGSRCEISAWLLCNSADMTDESRHALELVSEGGEAYSCDFEAERDDAGYDALIAGEEGSINADYADSAYRVTSITIPEDMPAGQYALRVTFSTPYGDQAVSLGSVTVLAHEAFAAGDEAAISATVGEWADANISLLANAGDLARDGAVTLALKGADAQSYGCEFEHEELPSGEFESLARASTVQLNADYVDSGWRITRVRVPENLPGGSYTLELAVSAARETLTYTVGALEIQQLEAVAGMDGDAIAGSAGEEVQTDIWVLCNANDFNSEFRKLSVVAADGTATACKFTSEKLDDDTYARYLADYGDKLDAGYAGALYAITGVTIPQSCSATDYSLVLEMETMHHFGSERYSWELGLVQVVESNAPNDTAAGAAEWVDTGSGYAIGFDAPLQASFRGDDIVLTGWVWHQEGSAAYFDHCELLDAYGRPMFTSYFTGQGELTQSARGDIYSHSRGMAGGTTQNAGFIIRLDASGARINSGDTYTLQLYTSNVQGEGWQTAGIQLTIDDSAPEVAQATLDSLIRAWTPAAPAESPVTE